MSNRAKVIAAAILTVLLRSPVKNCALEHHTQFNVGVMILLFTVVLLVFKAAEEFCRFWTTCDAMADVVEEDDE